MDPGSHGFRDIVMQMKSWFYIIRKKHRCPACGTLTDRVHDYRMQTVKDIPLGRITLLHLSKRSYRCDRGKRFFEENIFLPRYYRSTSRLVVGIINAFRETASAAKIGAQFIEGCNNKTKVLKRVCFGMRTFSNFRKKILFCHTQKSCRSDPLRHDPIVPILSLPQLLT